MAGVCEDVWQVPSLFVPWITPLTPPHSSQLHSSHPPHLQVNIQAYTHHVLVYPLGLSSWGSPSDGSCGWAGNAVIGMAQGTWSYAWVAGEYWRQPQVRGQRRHRDGAGHLVLRLGGGRVPEAATGVGNVRKGYAANFTFCCSAIHPTLLVTHFTPAALPPRDEPQLPRGPRAHLRGPRGDLPTGPW